MFFLCIGSYWHDLKFSLHNGVCHNGVCFCTLAHTGQILNLGYKMAFVVMFVVEHYEFCILARAGPILNLGSKMAFFVMVLFC